MARDLETYCLLLPTWKICVYFIRERECIHRKMFAFLILSSIFWLPCATRRRNLLFYQCYFCLFEFPRDLSRNEEVLNAIHLYSSEIITQQWSNSLHAETDRGKAWLVAFLIYWKKCLCQFQWQDFSRRIANSKYDQNTRHHRNGIWRKSDWSKKKTPHFINQLYNKL